MEARPSSYICAFARRHGRFSAGGDAIEPLRGTARAYGGSARKKTAACLRSDKAFSVCRDEMLKSCQAMSGDHGCPMMGMGHGRMGPPPEGKPDPE
jgi:hypothetical protein